MIRVRSREGSKSTATTSDKMTGVPTSREKHADAKPSVLAKTQFLHQGV